MTRIMHVNGKFTDIYSYIKTIFFLMVQMTVGVTSAWGQTDYSGVYYIGSRGYNPANTTTNFYLCPTENWSYYTSTSPYYTNTPNDQPFLTTYTCRDGVYDATKAVWIIEKHPTSDYYYIKRAIDGKYLTYNTQIGDKCNAGRMRLHLEAVADGDNALFQITVFSGSGLSARYVISTKNSSPEANRKYLNIAGANGNSGNFKSLQGTNAKTDGPTNCKNVGGILGLWTSGDDLNGSWYLEPATIAPPTITNNYTETNTITITAESGATIYYTTDGTTPTISTPTSGITPVSITVDQNSDVQVIKALAKGTSDDFPTIVKTYNLPVLERPVITVEGDEVTITATTGASIFYTLDNTEATPSSTPYSSPFNMGDATAIRAIATHPGYYRSAEAYSYPPLTVHSSSEISDMTRSYILASDFSSTASIGTSGAPFKGTIDGNMVTLSGLSHPLVAYADGAIIKNVFVDNVNISADGNAGAICGNAAGDSRIYNCGVLATSSTVKTDEKGYTSITSCSSSVSGTGYAGGIVGLLDGSSRVINCFSYANITGGTHVGGIVGYNNVGTTSSNIKTMVFACMFYGNISGGSDKAPIYNGNIISNRDASGVGNFNYFRSDASWAQNQANINTPNCALMAEDRFLQRFEFFRHLLNSQCELSAWWVTGDRSRKDEIMKWVLEPSQIGTSTPYPVLKARGKYPSVVNIDVHHSNPSSSTIGTVVGTLGVTIQMGSGGAVYGAPTGASISTSSLSLNITDKDPAHFNFNYRKVQLPYYNDVGSGNYTGNRVVTGWKIVGITTDGTGGTSSFTTGDDATTDASGNITRSPYNFADRNCTDKDLYSVSKRVFNQGAYWDVPEGVTDIIIEPYWAKAAYLSDAYADVVYDQTMENSHNVPNVGGGQIYTDNTSYAIAGSSQVVRTSIGNAVSTLFKDIAENTSNGHTVYDYAIVLVGNAHNIGISSSNTKRPYTIMSIDADHDNEPDYSYILRFNNRNTTHPVRVDFVNIPGLGMAQKSTGGTGTYNFGIMQPLGWFESTNTSLFRVTQFEYDNSNRGTAPYIVQGGVMEQWVSGQNGGAANKTTYFHVGGNVWFKEFHRGTHQDKQLTSKHPPVSVTGGDYDEFYLTGLYRGDVDNYEDNAECYINGGRFGTVCGAAQEGIGKANGADNTGNIIWQIQNADINEFYAGGLNAAKPVTGNLSTTITGSHVGIFCGGPKFGDMSTGKKVVTNATNCEFGTYFGAGYGGNSYSRQAPYNHNNIVNFPHNNKDAGNDASWNAWLGRFYKQNYNATYGGVSTQFKYQFLPMSGNADNCARIFVEYVKFSLAKTLNVTSNLTGCTVTGNFYGGGNLGKVDGPATSTLTNCTMKGDVFGAGFSASLPTVEVDSIGFRTEPYYYTDFGTYRTGVKGKTITYKWAHGDAISINTDSHILYTTETLTGLGAVTGKVTLNIEGTTTVDGNVYGGGESSDATGDAEVNVKGGTFSKNVFGGGKGETTTVQGNVTVNIGPKAHDEDILTIGNVYGGSAFGAVNATKDPSTGALTYTATTVTGVNISNGAVTDSVFGGGLGQTSPSSIAAQNFGNTTVSMASGTAKAVFGGANTNGVLKADATVTILGGTVGTDPGAGDPKNVVFGGGYGQPTLVEGNVTVSIGREKTGSETENVGTGTIWGNVYGGGALGNVNTSKPESVLVFDATKKTNVYLYKGTVNGNVFGGGLGKQEVKAVTGVGKEGDPDYVAPVAHEDAIEAFVGGDVYVLLDGAKLGCTFTGEGENRMPVTGQIFGANNLNGTPKGHVKVHVKRTVDSPKPSATARDARTTYDVAAVYGGGNQADYVPENATAAYAEVIIEGCDETSIEYVYGGGNAAAVPATDVTILGSYIIDYVFGGGNGKSTDTFTNPGANIGIYNNNGVATNYGSGEARTKLVGGHIHVVYGGSNTLGNVRGGTFVTMPEKDPTYTSYNCCDVRDIREIYGAGNQADQDGAVTMILGCVSDMDYVYGGAHDAHVKGGVDLVITSGHFKGIFGGNDTSGSIQGPIKLTIEETGCDPLVIDNLYLGGNLAPYSVYGYKDVSGTLTARNSMSDGDAVNPPADDPADPDIIEHQLYRNPVLNVISCTSIGNVFGGGYGEGAVMYGSPTVNINMIKGNQAGKTDKILPKEYKSIPNISSASDNPDDKTITCTIKNEIGTIGNVYGGGQEANVVGNTAVNICTEEKVTERSSMGAPITGTPKDVIGANIIENVFGAGKGLDSNVNSAMVSGNTTITMVKGSVTKSVYGGGEYSQVGGNTTISISGGTIGKDREETSPGVYSYYGDAIWGNVFGGGLGNGAADADVKFGLVKGNTNITISNGTIYHNIYGGGALASVGDFTYDGTTGLPNGLNTANTGKATITITGGTIGTDGHENGMVFGSSRGEIDAPNAIHDKLAWVYDTEVNIGDPDAASGPILNGSLYGGGENGHVYRNATVTMNIGTVGDSEHYYAYRGNVYGAGCGTDMYWKDLDEDGNKDAGEDFYNPKAGIVQGNTSITINGGNVANNVYGAGSMGKVLGSTSVTINTDGAIGVANAPEGGNVYGAARGELDLTGKIPSGDNVHNYSTVNHSTVIITKGTVRGSVYGGGKAGEVTGAVSVTLNGGTVAHDVYGGGALAQTNTAYHVDDHPTYVTNVTLNGTTISGDLYGGGLGQLGVAGSPGTPAVLYTAEDEEVIAGTKQVGDIKTPAVEGVDEVPAIAADVNGPVKVTVTSGSVTNVFGCNNVNGMPKSTVEVEIGAKSGGGVLSGTGTISNSVYGGGNQAACTGSPQVTLYGGTVSNNIYGGGLGSTAKTGGATVLMEGGTVGNDIFGGGSLADVTGSVSVSIKGGTVTNDVYGGGALANTNTGNWDAVNNRWNVPDVTPTDHYEIVKHLTVGTSSVEGYYTDTSGGGLQGSGAKAAANTTYYKKLSYNPNIYDLAKANGHTQYTTTVSLTGGVIGNAYGGGLGQLGSDGTPDGTGNVKAMVYGDVAVTVDGAAFTALVEASAKNAPVTGRVFGCNNINGTPKGKVTVTINKTRRIDGGSHTLGEFEIQGVYGGGNLAEYVPQTYDGATEFGQTAKVIINDCEASISKVYGGGNAAKVPITDVTVNGAFEIGYVFGGGNGGDMIYKNGSWIDNTGADVTYYTNVLLKGGTIGQAFGGSDSRGTVYGGSDIRQETGGLCPLRIVNLYGAGNGEQASSAGDITVDVSGCGEYSEIQNVYGGSYKANITGSVTLNIKSGIFTSVFGGNDRRGSIGGNITVNIEETDNCEKPIIIQNLYGGCYQTAYPGENARTWDKVGDKENDASYTSFTTGKITVNVKSATRIDRIFGGSDRGDVTGDTEVNINMVRGAMSGHTDVPLPSHYTSTSKPSNITVTNTAGYVTVYGLIAGESSVEGYYFTDVYTKASGTAVAETTYYSLVPVTFAEIPSAEITVGTTNVSSYYTYDKSSYTQASGTAASGITYYKALTYNYQVPSEVITAGTTDVSSYYTHSTVSHTVATGKALPGITYYKPSVRGNILAGIGTIGNVYGGGNIGKVTGSTVVNICTEKTITMETLDDNLSTKDVDEKHPNVLGAHIYGDVFGGCNNATVTGDTEVNIGTGDYSTTANFEGIFIDKDTNGKGGTVYGGGNQGDVLGNTYVTMSGGNRDDKAKGVYVFNGLFGGGYAGSVGTYLEANKNKSLITDEGTDIEFDHSKHTCIGKPTVCEDNTGKCTVVISGGQVGPIEVATQGMNRMNGSIADPVPQGWIWGGGCGVIEDPSVDPDMHFKTYVGSTDVTIKGTALIMESVIGGGEFGRVLGNTLVKIEGGQIGVGANQTETKLDDSGNSVLKPKRYTDAQFFNPLTTEVTDENKLEECSRFPYGYTHDGKTEYLPYDPYYKKYCDKDDSFATNHPDLGPATTEHPSDGKTWIGCVFGGGSGYIPYEKADGSGYDWCHSAGLVEGNTTVEISGGHILTNVYGANEITSIKGTATVTMTGGTLGVPRTLTQIANHPLSCYLFGGGKGDQRSHFDQYTNAGNVVVDVSGGIIYGSVFGGSEDGHVLGNAVVNISGGTIGTWGTSYVDGNVFGGGRGFSGENLTAGTIGGNVDVNISGGTMLGSIYGGGRLASVGVDFSKSQSADSGQFTEDDDDNTYGHVTIDISGGTIGNDIEAVTADGHTKGGNVFGGSMGRLTLLDGSPNPLWSKLAQVKTSSINITGNTLIKSNVYGGAEFGTTRDRAFVTVGGTRNESTGAITPDDINTPIVNGCVYGSGYGSTIDNSAYNSAIVAGETTTYLFTPMQYAGIVGGETVVNIVGKGHVLKNVYGGGEMASVGVIDYSVTEDKTNGTITYNGKNYKYLEAVKHDSHSTDDKDVRYDFGLSWPYEFKYVKTLKDKGTGQYIEGGKTTVNITGSAQVGQYVYGGGKGRVWFGATQATEEDITEQRYREAHIANVRETHVTIGTSGGSGDTPTIGPGSATAAASVYGGGEDGHVLGDANITIYHGTIGHSVFGGGKGLGMYKTTLWKATGTDDKPTHEDLTNQDAYSWTAGRVYGNTAVTMYGGKVGWFIYGGGNLGSVGKGSYTGGSDDYSKSGYGEMPSTTDGAIWATDPAATSFAHYFQNSGIATVNILGGTVGTVNGGKVDLVGETYNSYQADGVPYGSVFGGSRGKAAASCKRSPRYRYVPDFFLGYTNNNIVNIGGTKTKDGIIYGTGPTIHGAVYGGGQDGHVRNSTEVHIYKGNIAGQDPSKDTAGRTGNVFGAGSGIGTFDTVDSSNNPIKAINNSSGSVTCTTLVEVNGGSIARDVYGGGAIASVGPPKTGPGPDEQKASSDDHASYSYTRVEIKGGSVGGSVFAACRGASDTFLTTEPKFDTTGNTYDPSKYATNIWSYLYVTGGTVGDNVYGGGEAGRVKQSTEVHLTGGTITNNAYGGGKGTLNVPANVLGNTLVELNKEADKKHQDGTDVKGCIVKKVFGGNNFRGTPKGHVKVHVFATQNSGKDNISQKIAPPDYTATQGANEGYRDYLTRLISETTVTGGLASNATVITDAQDVLDKQLPTTAESTWDDATKKLVTDAAEAIITEINKLYDYDVQAVYGGGDLAMYEPTIADESTEVIIEGCDVTSIQQVYGGGNAAPVSGTNVLVSSCFIIDEVFGGGNGKDNYQIGTTWYENPGANVGYRQMSHFVESDKDGYNSATHGTGAQATPYKAIENDGTDGYPDAREPEERRDNYTYGNGKALTTINGGHIHAVYGCSNQKGNIRAEARSVYQESGTCSMVMDNTYGGSKTADNDAEIIVEMDCVKNGGTYFGGSYKANIYSDINIHITNGTYAKVFGGNDRAGTVNGKITITIEENGCTPIRIDELYAGGNLAPYSVYGYKKETENAKDADGNDLHEDNDPSKPIVQQRIPCRAGELGARTTPYWDPRINIISATWIGEIYGGGYGAGATMIGSPHVNVNMTTGRIRKKYASDYPSYADATDGSDDKVIPIGTIGKIYGGGNLASVDGDTYVEIGTGQWISSWDANGNPVWESTNDGGDKYSYKEKTAAVYYTQTECDTYNADPVNNVTGYIASGTSLSADLATAVNSALGTSYVEGAELTTKDANAYNATLPGARKTTDIKTVYYTETECITYNATLEGALNSTDPLTTEQATAYNTAMSADKSAGYTLTAVEANAYNATLTGARKTTDVKTTVNYTQAECDEYNKALPNFIAKHTKLSAAESTRVNTALTPSYVEGNTISEADRNAYNATLPNARKTTDVKENAVWAWYDAHGNEVTTSLTLNPRNTATITGDVFGGGKGVAEETGATAFTCAKGMIGFDGDGIDYPEGGTSVTIGNGTVSIGGSVYGGGEVGRVEKNTNVTIGQGDGTGTTGYPVIAKDVFGAGKGVDTHGYSALVRGNSIVTIQGDTKVGGSVYGGGEIASIGRYNVVGGRPTSLKNPNSGNCIVTVRGYAEIGPDDMTMTKVGGPDNTGHVFGASKGVTPGIYTYEDDDHRPWNITKTGPTDPGTKVWCKTEKDYLDYVETLGLATQTNVTIGGHAFVKGDVFGGAEEGFVQHDTHVTIEGNCQIGNGYVQMDANGSYLETKKSVNRRYTNAEWAAGYLIDPLKDGTTAAATGYTSSLPECASWPYAAPYAPYDKYAEHENEGKYYYDSSHTKYAEGGRTTGSDGHTFFGNVFGGGSGYFPYKAGKWHWKAGNVGGNTLVEIKGGHVLTNVYGANEMTNVEGKATVRMTGGTIGVPRTLGQIINHPVTCYLFGGGSGDMRVLFNKQTNVQDAEVSVTGGWVYGSVFGGGEDGHVMRNVDLTIGGTAKIGTWGTSYVDGNIFGGGRGFSADAYTAGNVAGCVNMTISGGEILGSVYGGGRLGSVGYGLYDAGVAGFGEMRDDNKDDEDNTVANFKRGHVDITISGGTIGNDYEYKYIEPETTIDDSYRSTNHIPYTEFGDDKHLTHTKGGNVFAGGMGRMTQLDGTTAINDVDWWKLGNVKSTKLTITGGTIKSNVYGGGELGMVQGTHTSADSKAVSTEIIISGGTIGTEITKKVDDADVTQYTFGSVFGGGYGSLVEKLDHTGSTNPTYTTASYYYTYPKYIAGRVKGSTEVTMTGGAVKASVYGGGEMAAVGESYLLKNDPDQTILGETLTGAEGKARDGHTYVTVSGGTIGIPKVGDRQFGSGTMGNVYGGGSGYINTVRSGQIYGNTYVSISGTPTIYHNIYGGGAYGTVGDFTYGMTSETVNGVETKKVSNITGLHANRSNTGTANVTITGGTIGVDGHENGMVFGSSRGEVDVPGKRPDWLAWVNTANVTIGTAGHGYDAPEPQIMGSVYGSGENGHTYQNTVLNIHSGTIGDKTATKETFYKYRGNVYGGGCGEDQYDSDDDGTLDSYNPTAGIVRGNTEINIDGGLITGSVYGAGAVASVGYVETMTPHRTIDNEGTSTEVVHGFGLSWPYKFVFAEDATSTEENKVYTGKATINITGGHIGIDGTDGGDVYGSARGEAGDRYTMAQYAYVNNAEVNVAMPSTAAPSAIGTLSTPCITGSVHGSGENGYVYGDTKVTLNEGLIGHSLYGAGKGIGTYKKNVPILTGEKIGQDKLRDIYGLLSGKVLGNTLVTMNGGQVVRNVYGGGNMASVGKGNYAGGTDDYSTGGYGETLEGNLWDEVSEESQAFLNSGRANVRVFGGTVGDQTVSANLTKVKNGLPYGNVIGGSAGEAAPNVRESPRYLYCPDFFSGYVNETKVTIGGGYECIQACEDKDSRPHAVGETQSIQDLRTLFAGLTDIVAADGTPNASYWKAIDAPTILSSVYGGGQDGHVRRDTHVIVNGGTIGLAYNSDNQMLMGTSDRDHPLWLLRGNVFGGGSGINKYQFDFNGDGEVYMYTGTGESKEYTLDESGNKIPQSVTYYGNSVKEEDYSTSAGSVTRFTDVEVLGGTIHRNVYGGGSIGSVGAPKIPVDRPDDPVKRNDDDNTTKGKQSQCTVTIGGAGSVSIGSPTEYKQHYGGEVYGAGRGMSDLNPNSFSSCVWTEVHIKDGAKIMGNVFGGGDAGMVKKDAKVIIGEK